MMKKPVISAGALMTADAVVCGDVTLEENVNLWFHSVLRA